MPESDFPEEVQSIVESSTLDKVEGSKRFSRERVITRAARGLIFGATVDVYTLGALGVVEGVPTVISHLSESVPNLVLFLGAGLYLGLSGFTEYSDRVKEEFIDTCQFVWKNREEILDRLINK